MARQFSAEQASRRALKYPTSLLCNNLHFSSRRTLCRGAASDLLVRMARYRVAVLLVLAAISLVVYGFVLPVSLPQERAVEYLSLLPEIARDFERVSVEAFNANASRGGFVALRTGYEACGLGRGNLLTVLQFWLDQIFSPDVLTAAIAPVSKEGSWQSLNVLFSTNQQALPTSTLLIEHCTEGGSLYCIPLFFDPFVIHYRLSQRAAFNRTFAWPPTTLADLRSLCAALPAGRPCVGVSAEDGSQVFDLFSAHFAGKVKHRLLQGGDLALSDPVMRETATFVIELIKTGMLALFDNATDALEREACNMILAPQSWSAVAVGLGRQTSSFLWPRQGGGRTVALGALTVIGLPRNAANIAGGAAFLGALAAGSLERLTNTTQTFSLGVYALADVADNYADLQRDWSLDDVEFFSQITFSVYPLPGVAEQLQSLDRLVLWMRSVARASVNVSLVRFDALASELEDLRFEEKFLQCMAPLASLPGGLYERPIQISLHTSTLNATVYYTLDGTMPSELTSAAYDAAAPILLAVSGVRTLKAFASKDFRRRSELLTVLYDVRVGSGPGKAALLNGLSRVIIGVCAAAGVVLVGVGIWLWLRFARARRDRSGPIKLTLNSEFVVSPDDVSIEAYIASGASATVYRGRLRGVPVVVKVLGAPLQTLSLVREPPVYAVRSRDAGDQRTTSHELEPVNMDVESHPRARRRLRTFVNEASALVQLCHVNIVTVMGILLTPRLAIVTEYLALGSLYSILSSTRQVEARLARCWLVHIARAMAFLHAEHVVHGDLKSLNVLISDDMIAKLADFGATTRVGPVTREPLADPLAASIDEDRDGSTAQLNSSDEVMAQIGTVAWTAPELLDGAKPSPASDVYSFGILAWEVMTQLLPYRGLSQYMVVLGVGAGRLRPSLDALLPAHFSLGVALLPRCWAQQPSERLSFETILADLQSSTTSSLDATLQLGLPGLKVNVPADQAERDQHVLSSTSDQRAEGSSVALTPPTSDIAQAVSVEPPDRSPRPPALFKKSATDTQIVLDGDKAAASATASGSPVTPLALSADVGMS